MSPHLPEKPDVRDARRDDHIPENSPIGRAFNLSMVSGTTGPENEQHTLV